jgi:DNA-binding MarR family transcriptional regulator
MGKMTCTDTEIMNMLKTLPPMSAKDLAPLTGLKARSMVRRLRQLESCGKVVRRLDITHDLRVVLYARKPEPIEVNA